MARLDHQRHQKSLERGKGAREHAYRNELKTSAKNGYGHEHRIDKTEPGKVHVNAIRHSEKKISGKNGNGMRKSFFDRVKKAFFTFFFQKTASFHMRILYKYKTGISTEC